MSSSTSRKSLFLTPADVSQLSGYSQRKSQIRWLAEHGYAFDVSSRGQVLVLVEEVRRKLLTAKIDRRATEPNLEALRSKDRFTVNGTKAPNQ